MMHSSIYGKIEKARRYAQEPERLSLTHFTATFRGEHDVYNVDFNDGKWHCGCDFFSHYGVCSHTMAIERILGNRVAKSSQTSTIAQTAGA